MEFYEFVSAWLLGMFSNSLSKDSLAIEQIRLELMHLADELEILCRLSGAITASDIAKIIRHIKRTLRLLNVHQAGLFVKHKEFPKLIDESLECIRKWEQKHTDADIGSIREDLSSYWGYRDLHDETNKIKEMQRFLHAGLVKRLYIKFRISFKR